MLGGDGGLVLDGADGILGIVAPVEREHVEHDGERDVDLLAAIIVIAAADVVGDADDGEAGSVEGDPVAERRMAGKEKLGAFLAEDNDAVLVANVVGADETTLGKGHPADVFEIRLDPEHLAPSGFVLALLLDVAAIDERGRVADVGGLGADGLNVGEGEVVGTHAAVLAGDGRDVAVPQHDDVVAELGELALLAGAEAFAHGDEQQHGADTPGDAEHGEERAELVGADGQKNLSESVAEALHGAAFRYEDGGFRVPVRDG